MTKFHGSPRQWISSAPNDVARSRTTTEWAKFQMYSCGCDGHRGLIFLRQTEAINQVTNLLTITKIRFPAWQYMRSRTTLPSQKRAKKTYIAMVYGCCFCFWTMWRFSFPLILFVGLNLGQTKGCWSDVNTFFVNDLTNSPCQDVPPLAGKLPRNHNAGR